MAISDGDLSLLLSNLTIGGTGAITGSGVTSGVNNNVWPDISTAERLAGGERFRKLFWKNENALDSALKPYLFTPTLPTGASIQIGLGFNDGGDDDPTQGNMTIFGTSAVGCVVSDGADTRSVTFWGMNNAGTPVPVSETVALNGTTEVLTTTTWTKVWAVVVASESTSRAVTVKQGAAGTTRGVIPVNQKCCWLWVAGPSAKTAGIALPDLGPGANYGMWMRLAWIAGAAVVRPNSMSVRFEEGA